MSDDWLVVFNSEGRHSVWPAGLPVLSGWNGNGTRGDRSACLKWIAEYWTDLRLAGVGRQPK